MTKELTIYKTEENIDYKNTYKWMLSSHRFYSTLDRETLNSLIRLSKNGDNGAKQFAGRGIPMEDLYQVGFFGLDKCINKYDCEKASFATFALKSIRNELKTLFEKNQYGIVIPREMVRDINTIDSARNELYCDLQCEPTIDELSAFMMENNNSRFTSEYIKEVDQMKYCTNCRSLDMPFDDDENTTLVDVVVYEDERLACFVE